MLSLSDRDWKEFKIGIYFNIYTGGDLIMSKVTPGDYPIVSHSMVNNGVAAYTKIMPEKKLFDCNKTISLADRGNFHAYVQKKDFYIATRVKALEIKLSFVNKQILMFICPLINSQAVKFSYGNNCCDSTDILKILMPCDDTGNPDWQFMEGYIKEREQDQIETYREYSKQKISKIKYIDILDISQKEWRSFLYKDIFETIKRGKRLKTANHIDGDVPYISSSAINNGIDNFIGNTKGIRKFSNCLTVANSGSVGRAFYHDYEFVASDHVTQLKTAKANKYIYLFLATLVSRLEEKYNFNREINDKRINREHIMLPINDDSNPDWAYMEQYAVNIEYKKLNAYLE